MEELNRFQLCAVQAQDRSGWRTIIDRLTLWKREPKRRYPGNEKWNNDIHRVHKKFHLNCIHLKRRGDWWESRQIQIFAMQWLMGHSPCKYVKDVRLILKRKFCTGRWALSGLERIITQGLVTLLALLIHYGIHMFGGTKHLGSVAVPYCSYDAI